MFGDVIKRLIAGENLTEDESAAFLTDVMEGKATEAQLGAVLALLARKGETPDEVAGFVRTMRGKALQIPFEGDAIDLCGTGGDGAKTVNISTAATFVVAACGVTVAKHGNRAATSASGGADVLESLGLTLEAPPEKLAAALRQVGVCFLFARSIHPAMRYVAKTRGELGVRTVFNILGPLTNPVAPRWQLLGVFSPDVAPLMADVLGRVGCERAWFVHGAGGLDEVSPAGPTRVWEAAGGTVREFTVSPNDFGLPTRSIEAIRGGTPEENAKILRSVFAGVESPALEAVLMNAACALVVAGKAADVREGVALARSKIEDGTAARTLDQLVQFMAP